MAHKNHLKSIKWSYAHYIQQSHVNMFLDALVQVTVQQATHEQMEPLGDGRNPRGTMEVAGSWQLANS